MEKLPIKFPCRRTRMISFRVSDGEFEQLKTKSEAEGARSIRLRQAGALCTGGVSSDQLDQGISRLSDDVQQLKAEVRRVTESLEASGPAAPRLNLAEPSDKKGSLRFAPASIIDGRFDTPPETASPIPQAAAPTHDWKKSERQRTRCCSELSSVDDANAARTCRLQYRDWRRPTFQTSPTRIVRRRQWLGRT